MRRLCFSRFPAFFRSPGISKRGEREWRTSIALFIFAKTGSSKIYSVEQAKGRVGSYGIRWYEDKRQRQKIIGQYSAAAAAKLRKELELRKACRKANSIVLPEESMKLHAAIETVLHEREDLNADPVRRWIIELDLFKEQSGKVYLSELTREDVFAYRKWYKDRGRSENTIALRTSSLLTLGTRFNVQIIGNARR